MADYIYLGNFQFSQQESQYGRWSEPWRAKCSKCGEMTRVSEGESAADFLDRLYMHSCKK